MFLKNRSFKIWLIYLLKLAQRSFKLAQRSFKLAQRSFKLVQRFFKIGATFLKSSQCCLFQRNIAKRD